MTQNNLYLNTKILTITFFCILFLIVTKINGQSNAKYVLNNGGGYSSTIQWSFGEFLDIVKNPSSNTLSSHEWQPFTSIVKEINDTYGPTVFGSQITIGPNPTSNLLHIKAKFNEMGTLSIQLVDANSTIVFMQEVSTILSNFNKDIFMNNFPSGIFYLKVYFKKITGDNQIGIYKIIKL